MVDRIASGIRIVICVLIVTALAASLGLSSTVAQEEDATALLNGAATAMAEVESFHFELSTPRGSTSLTEGLTLLGITGDVQRPDRFQAVARVDATIAQLNLTVIGVGTKMWVTDPLSAEATYMEIDLVGSGMGEAGLGDVSSFTDLINPDRLLLTAVENVEDPVIAGQDSIDGITATRINGVARLDPLASAGLVGTPVAGMSVLGEPVQVAIWVDDGQLVRQLDVYGPLLAGEAPNTVRRLKLSAFDEPIDIQPPTPVAAQE